MGVPQVSPGVGSPIRESPDRRLRAPTRSLSQLATPFVSAQAEPSFRWRIMPSPLGTHVRFASNFSEASSTQHFIVDPGPVQGLTLAFFTLKTGLESCILIGS